MNQHQLSKGVKQTAKRALEAGVALSRNIYNEELANFITHGVATLLSIAALWAMLLKIDTNDTRVLTCVLLYGGSMILVFVSSSLLHYFHDHKSARVFLILDHAAIYIKIAGTYTPIALLALGAGGEPLMYILWSMAVLGLLYKIIFAEKWPWFSLIVYVVMGWLGVFYSPDLYHVIGPGFDLFLMGGLFYTVGTIFFMWRQLPYHHAIWHIFVMMGSCAVFFSIYDYVLV